MRLLRVHETLLGLQIRLVLPAAAPLHHRRAPGRVARLGQIPRPIWQPNSLLFHRLDTVYARCAQREILVLVGCLSCSFGIKSPSFFCDWQPAQSGNPGPRTAPPTVRSIYGPRLAWAGMRPEPEPRWAGRRGEGRPAVYLAPMHPLRICAETDRITVTHHHPTTYL